MTYMNPMVATQMWLAWSGALWAQQIKVSQIMAQAAQENALAMMGLEPPMDVLRDQEAEQARNRARAVSPRVLSTISEAQKSRRTKRAPSTPPTMPPRRTHATPV